MGKKMPVLVGSWSEEQEAKILATLDPLAAMAETNIDQLKALLASVQTDARRWKNCSGCKAKNIASSRPAVAAVARDPSATRRCGGSMSMR